MGNYTIDSADYSQYIIMGIISEKIKFHTLILSISIGIANRRSEIIVISTIYLYLISEGFIDVFTYIYQSFLFILFFKIFYGYFSFVFYFYHLIKYTIGILHT